MEATYRARPFRNRLSNIKSQIPRGTQEIILAVVGAISCFSGFILNGDQTTISVLNQEISNTTYTWLSNILIFIGSPLLFFAAYIYSSGIALPSRYIIGVLVIYGILVGISGYLISKNETAIFSMDKDSSSTLNQIYGWFTVGLGSIMFLYAGFLAYA